MGHLTLDIGCGPNPWILKQYQEFAAHGNEEAVTTPLMKAVARFEQSDRYICIDHDARLLEIAKRDLDKIKEYDGKDVQYLEADGTKLPFESEVADIAILSDVLSAPDPYQAMDAGERLVSVRECAKMTLIDEALRVLKPDGRLIIAIYQTPNHANHAMQKLRDRINQKEIVLAAQYGEYEPQTDIWNLYEVVLMKRGAYTGEPLIVPTTEAQRLKSDAHATAMNRWAQYC
jgi:ubiquinone/menaquinone biosynthesis C-methylase UbiE